jgi:hypothetical protein
MDEQNHAPEGLARSLREGMEAEARLFSRLGADVDRLRDSFQAKQWTQGLTIAQSFESAALEIEAAERARGAAFASLVRGIGAPQDAGFHEVILRVPIAERTALYESWRELKMSVFRLKTATGRLRYSSETMADTLNRILEAALPHRRGKIYTRHGTASGAVGSLLVDREL